MPLVWVVHRKWGGSLSFVHSGTPASVREKVLRVKQNTPSATALLIAKSQLLLADEALFAGIVDRTRANFYRRFVEAAIGTPWHLTLVNRNWLKFIQRISLPGLYLHYALRKRCIEQVTREFLETAQIQQVVGIAGGFDPLLAMLCEQFKKVEFFELDHPATQQAKRAALQSINNLTLLPIDLTNQSVFDVLHGTAFSPEKPTLFIAEGITMYLDEQEIRRFFGHIQSCTVADNCFFLFTYMNKQSSGSIQFESATKWVEWWLWLKKEVFKWGIATEDLPDFLSAMGYRFVRVFDADSLTKEYLASQGGKNIILARGENICLAQIFRGSF